MPGKDGAQRDAMTASRLGRVGVQGSGLALPAAPRDRRQDPVPCACAASRARRSGGGLSVVGFVLFDGATPAHWTEGYWAVRELLPAAIAFSIGGAVLLRYRKAWWPAGALLICGLLAGLALLFESRERS
jgi:hypothetical protein